MTKGKQKLSLLAILVTLCAVLYGVSHIHEAGAVGSITLAPTSGIPGSTVEVTGFGFGNNTLVSILVNQIPIANATSSASGNFSTTITMSVAASDGIHVVTATDGMSSTDVTFTVIAPVLRISPETGLPSSAVAISGSNFAGSKSIIVKFDGVTISTVPSSVQSTSSGTFLAIVNIPSTATSGRHSITAEDGIFSIPVVFDVSESPSSITLSATSAPAGTLVTVKGTGFTANTSLVIKIDLTTLATTPASIVTDTNGSFTAVITIPTGIAGGSNTLSAVDASGRTGSAIFTVINVDTQPNITISPVSGPPGSTVTISGTGFPSDTSMAVLYDHALLREIRTDASGTFTITVRIPTNAVAGTHRITLSDIPELVHATFNVALPSLLVSPNAGVVGTAVTVSGSNFGASEDVTIKFDNGGITTIPASLRTSTIGAFSATMNIPVIATPGVHTISATNGLLTASEVFNILYPSITLSGTSGAPGSAVTVTGTGFSANSLITIKFDSTKLVTSQTNIATNSLGTFSTVTTVPAVLASGAGIVSAVDASGRTGSAVINVVVPATITLSKTGGVQGSTVNISGSNFSPNSPITIKFDSAILPAQVTANILGNFETTINIPDDVRVGTHTISIIDSSGKFSSALFSVTTHGILTISPQTGPPGTEVMMSGWNFANGTKISIKFNSDHVGTYPPELIGSALGRFIGKFRIPANTTEGTYTISAEDITGRLATAPFTVSNNGLSLSLSSNNGKGGIVSLVGWGFAPRNLVTISFDGEIVPTTPLKIFASRVGMFTASFNVPGNAPNGNHMISAVSDQKVTNATLALNRNYIDDRYGVLISAFPQKYDFAQGETVTISGKVLALNNGLPLLLRVINPNGAACSFQQLSLDSKMNFEAQPIKLDGKLCSIDGEYKITAFYGKGKSLTKFSVAASDGELTGGEAEVLNARLIPSFIRYDNKYTVDLDWATNAVRVRNNVNQTLTFYLMFVEYDANEITQKLSYKEVVIAPFESDYHIAQLVPQIIDGKPNGYLHVFAWTSLNDPTPLHPGLFVPY